MPWTETARREYRRACPRYASDMTDREWALVAPFMPPPRRLWVLLAIVFIANMLWVG